MVREVDMPIGRKEQAVDQAIESLDCKRIHGYSETEHSMTETNEASNRIKEVIRSLHGRRIT